MSKFFTPPEFEEPRVVGNREGMPAEDFPYAEEFRTPIEKIRKEIELMTHGQSKLYPGAIQFPKGNCIPLVVLDRFYTIPNKSTLQQFLRASSQEFGARAAEAFADWMSEVYPEARRLL